MACNVERPSFVNSLTTVKLTALESSLQQCFTNFKDLEAEVKQIIVSNESMKTQFLSQTENKCKTCIACEEIKKSLVLTLTRFIETKDWNTLNEAFNILYGETTENQLVQYETPSMSSGPFKSPEKDSTTEDISFQEESVTEIDGTITGRTSPIIHTKKTRSTNSGLGEKKKCPTNWPTPEKKALKTIMLTPTRNTPNGKLRQSRLTFVKMKEANVVDLTLSPQFTGGARCSPSRNINNNTQTIIKKEQMNNDDTILPSPTSGSVDFALSKNTTKASQHKLKSLSRKKRTDNEENVMKNEMDDSVNLIAHRLVKNLNPSVGAAKDNGVVLRWVFTPQKRPLAENINCNNIDGTRHQPLKDDGLKVPAGQHFDKCPNNASDVAIDGDRTRCENDDSISLLKHVPMSRFVEHNDVGPIADPDATCCDTVAFVENNLLPCGQSISAYKKQEPLYKEPAPRTKAEKRALPGWWCNECKDFWPEVYKNDPEMIKKKMDECSKHRGKHNPIRPNTPEGYWNPRWEVPEDTEAFNRRNNII